MSQRILTTKTGGFSLLSLLLGIAGTFFLVLQVLAWLKSDVESASFAARFLPLLLGGACLLLAILGIRNGSIEVYTDHITGKTATGNSYSIKLSDIAQPDPERRTMSLKNHEGVILMQDKAPRFRKVNGLLWMLIEYPQLQALQWKELVHRDEDPRKRSTRYFLEGETPIFGDRGRILSVGDLHYFIPVSGTAPLPRLASESNPLSTAGAMQKAVPQFEPNPVYLPFENIVEAVFPGMNQHQQKDMLENWIGQCGISRLIRSNDDAAGDFEGKYENFRVLVQQGKQ